MSEATPQEVLDFWFSDQDEGGEVVFRRAWFEKDDAFDTAIRDVFEITHTKAAARELEAWREQPHTALALVVTLDQFSRNMFRDDPKMYAADTYAAEIAKKSLAKGYDKVFCIVQGWFFYMPLMHSEHLADQEDCVTLFRDSDGFLIATRLSIAIRPRRKKTSCWSLIPRSNGACGAKSVANRSQNSLKAKIVIFCEYSYLGFASIHYKAPR
jgi:uncharacterized protein (DUF924 family)